VEAASEEGTEVEDAAEVEEATSLLLTQTRLVPSRTSLVAASRWPQDNAGISMSKHQISSSSKCLLSSRTSSSNSPPSLLSDRSLRRRLALASLERTARIDIPRDVHFHTPMRVLKCLVKCRCPLKELLSSIWASNPRAAK